MTGWVYIAEIDGLPGRLKIGKTNWHNPEDRIHDISKDTGAPGQMSLIYAALFDDPRGAERAAHIHLDSYRRKGEWFEISTAQHLTNRTEAKVLQQFTKFSSRFAQVIIMSQLYPSCQI